MLVIFIGHDVGVIGATLEAKVSSTVKHIVFIALRRPGAAG